MKTKKHAECDRKSELWGDVWCEEISEMVNIICQPLEIANKAIVSEIEKKKSKIIVK